MSPVQSDMEFIGVLVAQYYDWLTDNGGISPTELLSMPMTGEQRKLLLRHMDNVLAVYGLTADIRCAAARL